MDIYLRMAWRDFRLIHNFSKPLLVKDEDLLKSIWRPDPFFSNSKESEFHEVTFLNFLLRIFPGGEIYYETRCARILVAAPLVARIERPSLQSEAEAQLQLGVVQVSTRQASVPAQNRLLCVCSTALRPRSGPLLPT